MAESEEERIDHTDETSYTKITFWPDLKRFKMKRLDSDICELFRKRVYDMAGVVKGVSVTLNGSRVPVRSWREYIHLFPLPTTRPTGVGGAGAANSGKADRLATTAQESLIQFLENPKFSPRGE